MKHTTLPSLAAVALPVLLVGALFAETANAAPPRRTIRDIGVLAGSCQRLIAFGDDITGQCGGKLVNMDWSDGRDSFTFSSKDGGLALTFSGDGNAQIKQGADTAVQPVDAIFAGMKDKTSTRRAVGSCRFSNPYKGPVSIICTAATPQGDFSATFMTDGAPPDIKHFGPKDSGR